MDTRDGRIYTEEEMKIMREKMVLPEHRFLKMMAIPPAER